MAANDMTYERPNILVETDWLERHLDDPDLRVFDCTAHPAPNPDPELRKKFPISPTSGCKGYDEKHIPGTGYMDIPGDLADQSSAIPMMILPERRFVDAISNYGIGDDTKVVFYSADNPMWAARAWWMLRHFSFVNAAILNGGLAKWMAEGRPVSKQPCAYSPATFTARSRTGTVVGKDEVVAALGDKNVRVIHALTPSIFAGTNDKLVFGRRGRIPGSVNVPSETLYDPETCTYLPAARLREIFDAAGAGDADRIITYCGGGVNASNDAFALTLLGYENVAVYDGSMSEWGNDESLPIETG